MARVSQLLAAALLAALVVAPAAAEAPDAPSPGPTAPPPVAERGARLTLTVKGVESATGVLLVRVFVSEDAWLDDAKAIVRHTVPATGEDQTLVLEGLPPGPCAVSVIHDANENGVLDMRWFPYPRPDEKVGASRDPRSTFGPPDFEDAVFELPEGGKRLTITLW